MASPMASRPPRPPRCLIISTFPPKHCGIGRYAQEQLLALKKAGKIVYTMAFDEESMANYRCDFSTIRGLLRAGAIVMAGRFDEVYMQYSDELILPNASGRWPMPRLVRLAQLGLLGWLGAWCGKKLFLICHEVNARRESYGRMKRLLKALAFSRVRHVQFHTERERADYLGVFSPWVRPGRTGIVDHGRFFRPKFNGSREEARLQLGLPRDQTVMLCIGFWQRHKGFDEAVEAMAGEKGLRKHLYVVGSMRVEAEEIREYRDELVALAAAHPAVTLVEGFVSDEDFDRWITAADSVIIPYREIWSSSVGGRAMLLNTPLILRHHANLRDQFQRYPLARFYSNFNELQDLVRRTRRHEEMREDALPRKDGAGLVAGRKFLFVVAWFGAKVRGGHESFIFELCTELSHRGAEVEVWTTASTNLNHRNQDALRDSEEESRLPFRIRRFPANDRIEWLFNGIHGRLFNRGIDFPVVRALWKYSNLYGKGMKEMLLAESGRFDAIHLCHYLLGTSHRLGGLVPWKTLLHPAIHDEPPLHSRLMSHLFAGSAGVLCSTPAEVELARQGPCGLVPELYPVIGIGIRPAKKHPPQRLAKVDIFSQQGYLIFIGRLIREKNVPLLLKWHKSLTESLPNPPGLVLIGEGDLADKINWNEWPNTIHLPWIAPGEKRYALENALALVQPSLLESFSLVVMEAWQHGTPVIVHRHCRATHYHVEESRGGVAVATAAEYAHAVERFQDDPQQRKKCGEQGHRYVNEHYSWDAVIDRFGREVSHLLDWNGQHGTRP